MNRDAEAHASDDKKRRELAEARNAAEQAVYKMEKLLEENKDKLSEGDRTALTGAIEKVNEAKKGDDAAAINRSVDELHKAAQAMSEHLYAAASADPGAPGGTTEAPASGGAKPDDVIDVEFEEGK